MMCIFKGQGDDNDSGLTWKLFNMFMQKGGLHNLG